MPSIFVKRTIAYILDFFVVSAFMWILSFILSIIANPYNMNEIYHYFAYVIPILIMVYFVLCEKYRGATVGKSLMYLQVMSRNGRRITFLQAIIRSISKIYWIPIIFDWAIGKIVKSDDRILNRLSNTIVIDELGY
ncbi:RDD family protein [Methanobrevibacter sp. DSM 116169]|uniref:RDD family protein n=1 Tax=Methanobrevibacter sp. DSM 116169 TaxID=3242727 RepID=UPI0038FCCF36